MIGGNTTATIQVKSTQKNLIGETEKTWVDAKELTGWLDLSSGDSSTTYNAKIQESTHVFISDYTDLNGITADDARMIVNGVKYEVKLIDNPMGMNQQLEIYLKYVGGGLGVQ